MKTELARSFKWGFVLSEQDLRRILQTCQEHFSKVKASGVFRQLLTAKLSDGSLVESDDVNDILTLENEGSKAVERIKVNFDDGKETKDHSIEVEFQDGLKNPEGWTSVSYSVVGTSRDWAFLAGSELEERLRKTKSIPSAYLVRTRWFIFVPMILAMVLSLWVSTTFLEDRSLGVSLETAYKNGQLKDPIEALIFLEKRRAAQHMGGKFFAVMMLSFSLPAALFWVMSRLLPRVYPSYNFYWGDYKVFYDKRKSTMRIFWTVVVLGVLVSLVAGLLLRII
jgi:hypothetical protein